VGYDGRKLKGFMYSSKPEFLAAKEMNPSALQLAFLVKDALKANLKPEYLRKYTGYEVYKPSEEVL